MNKRKLGDLYVYSTKEFDWGEMDMYVEGKSIIATKDINGDWISYNDICKALNIMNKKRRTKLYEMIDEFDKTTVTINRMDKYGNNHEQDEPFVRDIVVYDIIRNCKSNNAAGEELLYGVMIDLGKEKHDDNLEDGQLNYHDKVTLKAIKNEIESSSINLECLFGSLDNRLGDFKSKEHPNSRLIGFNNYDKDENGKYSKRQFKNPALEQAYDEFMALGEMLEDVNTAIENYLDHLDCGNNYDPNLEELHSKAVNDRMMQDYTWIYDDMYEIIEEHEKHDDEWIEEVNDPNYEPPKIKVTIRDDSEDYGLL